MRGNPWIRIMLVCLGVILMGWPVWKLTHADAVSMPVGKKEAATAQSLTVTVTFAHPPESFALTYLGQPILTGAGPNTDFTGPWQVGVPKDGMDLLLKVKWPIGTTHTAVEVKIESSEATLSDQTYWGTGVLTELITVLPPKS